MRKFCLFLVICLLLTGCTAAPSVNTTAPSVDSSTAAPTTGTTAPTTGTNDPTVPTSETQPAGTEATVTTPATKPTEADKSDPTNPPPTANATQPTQEVRDCDTHEDAEDDGKCDHCGISTLVIVDFYTINDLHGKIADADTHPGVDELTTYLKKAKKSDDHVVLLSTGDMWQGSSESNLTQGLLTTDWMNHLKFSAMALGNHEFDWGTEPVRKNNDLASFPLLAINIYDRSTNKQVSYCKSSVMVEKGGIQIGIIGAIGDCYSSISKDKVSDIYFKVDNELTDLVKKEAASLRSKGADYIVYLLHDGYGQSKSATATSIRGSEIDHYYDPSLSNGYVDLVFEGHSHQRYILKDEYGVYHLQNKGDNKGISHVEISVNTANGNTKTRSADLISTGTYANMADDPIVEELLDKYNEDVSSGSNILGKNAKKRSSYELAQLVADLYYKKGLELWGDEYDIVLGGGFMSVRSPYELAAGDVTYGMLYSLFPFDNDLVLCSIKGRDLQQRFFETDNDRYYLSYGDYGKQVKGNIDPNKTYYVVVDSYSSVYAPNRLTEVARYEEKYYARDMLADYAKSGGFQK